MFISISLYFDYAVITSWNSCFYTFLEFKPHQCFKALVSPTFTFNTKKDSTQWLKKEVLPSWTPWTLPTLVAWPRASYESSQASVSSFVKRKRSVGSLWGFSELVHAKCFEQWVAQIITQEMLSTIIIFIITSILPALLWTTLDS